MHTVDKKTHTFYTTYIQRKYYVIRKSKASVRQSGQTN